MAFGVLGGFVSPEKTYAANTFNNDAMGIEGCKYNGSATWNGSYNAAGECLPDSRISQAPTQTPTAEQIAQIYTDLTAKGLGIIDDQITYLKSKSTDQTIITRSGGISSAGYKQYLTENETLTSRLTQSKAVFTDSMNLEKSNGTNPDGAYMKSMLAAKASINNYPPASLKNGDIKGTLGFINTTLQNAATEKLDILRYSKDPKEVAAAKEIYNSSAAATFKAAQVAANDPSKCTLLSWSIVSCIDTGIAWIIKHTLLELAGFLVWATANMFNLAIQVGVLEFSKWAPPTLYPIWIIVRQIISLFIVFAGLYLGLMYIMGRSEDFKKYIPWVIIFALFVNFSYPLTRALIDVSNIVSLNVYASTVGTNTLTGDPNNTAGALIMNRLGLQGLVASAVDIKTQSKSLTDNISSTPGALLAVAFVLYAAYIFFMVTAIFVVRTAVLIFLTIASPILFIDSVIPKLGEEAVKLRKMFFEQLIVAPIFMVMLALTLKFLEVFQGKGGPLSGADGNGAISALSATNPSSVTTFFNILMMLIMLHIMLKVTKHVAGSVGQMATNAMGTVGGFGLGLASGGAGLLARGTLGRVASRVAAGEGTMGKWVQNNQDSFLGRRAYNMTNSLANSTFDARNSGVIAGSMKKAGMGMGTGGSMGYNQELKAKVDDRLARFGRIKTENKDGTINQEGAEAKRRFYTKAGGVFTDKEKVREALMEKDIEGAEKQDKKLGAYDKLVGEKRQNYLRSEKDPAMKQQMLEHDMSQGEITNTAINNYDQKSGADKQKFFDEQSKETKESIIGKDKATADAMNKKLGQYEKLSNNAKQSYYERQSDDVKNIMQESDKKAAEEIDEKINKIDQISLEDYKKMSGPDKQQYYSQLPNYLQQKLKGDDETQARNIERSSMDKNGPTQYPTLDLLDVNSQDITANLKYASQNMEQLSGATNIKVQTRAQENAALQKTYAEAQNRNQGDSASIQTASTPVTPAPTQGGASYESKIITPPTSSARPRTQTTPEPETTTASIQDTNWSEEQEIARQEKLGETFKWFDKVGLSRDTRSKFEKLERAYSELPPNIKQNSERSRLTNQIEDIKATIIAEAKAKEAAEIAA